jgi:hypothetical protein
MKEGDEEEMKQRRIVVKIIPIWEQAFKDGPRGMQVQKLILIERTSLRQHCS